MGTVSHSVQRGNVDRKQRWERSRRAALLDQYRALQAEGVFQRQAAKVLHSPRTTLQAWHMWQERLDACPQVVRSVDTGACLRIRLASAVAGECVRAFGAPASSPPGVMRRDAPEKSGREDRW